MKLDRINEALLGLMDEVVEMAESEKRYIPYKFQLMVQNIPFLDLIHYMPGQVGDLANPGEWISQSLKGSPINGEPIVIKITRLGV